MHVKQESLHVFWGYNMHDWLYFKCHGWWKWQLEELSQMLIITLPAITILMIIGRNWFLKTGKYDLCSKETQLCDSPDIFFCYSFSTYYELIMIAVLYELWALQMVICNDKINLTHRHQIVFLLKPKCIWWHFTVYRKSLFYKKQ